MFGIEKLKQSHITPSSALIVTIPSLERRNFAIYKKLYPNMQLAYSSESELLSFENCVISNFEEAVNVMIGEIQRIKLYPAKNYMIFQEIPNDVWQTFEELKKAGFTKYLIE